MSRHGRKNFLSILREKYTLEFKTILFFLVIFLTAGIIFSSLFLSSPDRPLSQLFLEIGMAFLTGIVFSLVLPIFLPQRSEAFEQEILVEKLSSQIKNTFLGVGQVWMNEDAFANEIDFVSLLHQQDWSDAIFLGISLSRLLASSGHTIEEVYKRTPVDRWRPCYFILSHPNSEYVIAHEKSEYGRDDVERDIKQSKIRIDQIVNSIANYKHLSPAEVPFHVLYTKVNVRFGLMVFKGYTSFITLYRYKSRSYFNPKIEVTAFQPGTREASPLGEWIEEYADLLITEASSSSQDN